MSSQQDIHRTLEATFAHIQQTRMEGVPVINNKLSVKAIGFHEWNNNQLGILITPWFMNLMLFPQATKATGTTQATAMTDGYDGEQSNHQEGDNKHVNKVGSIQPHAFPSGIYDFVVAYEDDIGHYQSCSLFSPMFEFEDQPSAELTAKEALAAIMDDENRDIASQSRDKEIAQIWNGEKPAPPATDGFSSHSSSVDHAENTASKPHKPHKLLSERIKERIDEPTSRRDFLRGNIFRSGDE